MFRIFIQYVSLLCVYTRFCDKLLFSSDSLADKRLLLCTEWFCGRSRLTPSPNESNSNLKTVHLFIYLFIGIQEKLGIMNNGEVYAVFSYEAQQSDELTFDVNDQLIIIRKGDDAEREWWWAKMKQTGSEGYVPRNLLGVSESSRIRNLRSHLNFTVFRTAVRIAYAESTELN